MTVATNCTSQDRCRLHLGDSSEVLKSFTCNSIDAIITDPPAGIGFMNKDWDDYRRAHNAADVGRSNVFGRTSRTGPEYGRARAGFVTAMTPIFVECLRVLKPGAHGLVWALPRTSHWTATVLEDAGFEVRDCVTHLFGNGFPKSLNLGDGRGTALKPAAEFWWLIRKPLGGTVAQNVEEWGTGVLNIDRCRVAGESWKKGAEQPGPSVYTYESAGDDNRTNSAFRFKPERSNHPAGRWPAHLVLTHAVGCAVANCVEGCPALELDTQSGLSASKIGRPRGSAGSGEGWGMTKTGAEYNDTGGASRFFPVFEPNIGVGFHYQAKATTKEKNRGLPLGEKNTHPTVKSLGLMRWLCRLITPPGGTILDPFAGSGSTLVAALQEGFQAVGVEREDEYFQIMKARIEDVFR